MRDANGKLKRQGCNERDLKTREPGAAILSQPASLCTR